MSDAAITASPRRRHAVAWTILILLGLLSLLACIVLYGEARFHGEINSRHARGQRVLPEDFQWSAVADDVNAATYLSAAADQLKTDSHQAWLLDHLDNGPLVSEQLSYARELLVDKADALEAIRKARDLDQADWHVKVISPVIEKTLLPHLNEQRRSERLLQLIALAEHETGRESDAVEHMRDILGISRALDRQATGVVTHLVASGIGSVTAYVCVRIAPSLMIEGPSAIATERSGTRAATREGVIRLIGELLDERLSGSGLQQGIEWDRMAMIDGLREGNGDLPRWLQRQVGAWQSVEPMHDIDNVAAAAQAADWRSMKKPMARSQPPTNTVSGLMLNHAPLYLESQMQVLVTRRIAATALALRLYQIDHGGQWPATLDALVPQYLPMQPIDTFSSTHAMIGYLLGNPPALYSVSTNEIDDHGDRTGAMTVNGYNPWRSPDAVFPLGGVQTNEPWDPAGPSKD